MSKFITKFDTQSAYEAAQSSLILPNVSLISETRSMEYKQIAPLDPCASQKVQTTYEWVEIGGVKWATKNVGALTETDYGQYFSWGGVSGYTADQVSSGCHSFSWENYEFGNGTSSPTATGMSKYNSSDGKTTLEPADDAATVNMGEGWKTPSTYQFQLLLVNYTTSAWTADYEGSGVAGLVLTSKADSSVKLFFPAAGTCYNNSVGNVGKGGNYWSSGVYKTSNEQSWSLSFGQTSSNYNSRANRQMGLTIRSIFTGS